MKVKLGDFISEHSERNKQNANIPVYSVTNSRGFVSEYFNKEVASKDKTTYKLVPRGYFAYNPSRINVGSVDFQRKEDCVIVSPLYVVFHVADELDKNYLLYYLKSQPTLCQIKHVATGSVRDNLKFSYLSDFSIELKPIEEQIKIAKTLQHLEAIIAGYKNQVAKLDELVKCRFVEMFGDPVTNPKQFPCFLLGEIVKFQGGSQPDKKHFEYESSPHNIRLLQIRDYKSDRFATYIPKALAKRFCSADDIMIGRYGPPIFQILGGIEGAYNVALMKAIPQRGNKEFIRQFLKQDCLLKYLEGLSKRTAGQDGIQMDKLKSYPFPYPPDKLQDAFASFVRRIDKLRFFVWLV